MTFFALLVSFLVSFSLCPFLRRLALRWDIVDYPEVRKLQKSPVPLLGGVAVYLGVVVASFMIPLYQKFHLDLFISSTLIFIVSLIDDKQKLSARVRIIVQLVAASILILGGIRISFLPNSLIFNILEVLITFMWILGMTNAFNYLDGVDGLCSGLGIVTSFFFFVILFSTGQNDLMFLPVTAIGACLGFLPYNLRKDKMFLGDGGSMFVGFTVAAFALLGSWASNDIIKISIPILILGVPIFDMTFTTIMRYRERKIRNMVQWLEYAGRDHFHHYLMDLGLKSRGAVYFILVVSVSMGLSALIIANNDRPVYAFLTILKSSIMFGLISVLMVLGRRRHKEAQVKERMGI
ncbi:MAG: MraY family glycosyltransferase [Candidatus Omnitrophota bacterium]